MSNNTFHAAEVKNRFDRVLREISRTGGPIIVERDGKPVAVILSVSEYKRMQPQNNPTTEQVELLEACFGLWAERTDIGEDSLADGRSRWQSK